MRKIKFLLFLLLIFLLSFNISFATSNVAAAKSNLTIAKSDLVVTEDSMVSSDSAEKINYELPYPGLLPDNPLYLFRAIRDKVVGFLISSPLKKAEFDLLQADKRLNAGLYLFDAAGKDEKKINLAISTISKAENYFDEAIVKINKANNQGINTVDLTRKLLDASKKHQETIASLEERSKKNIKGQLTVQRRRVEGFEKKVNQLLSQ